MMELVVKTRDGTPVTHDVTGNVVGIKNPDGDMVDFVPAADVPVAVTRAVSQKELDFSETDTVTITPEEGQTFSAVNIPIPDNLIPENIRHGVSIAGIVGSLEPGANGIVMASGYGLGGDSDGIATIEHNLGVIPDIVFVFCGVPSGTHSNTLYMAIGFSTAFSSKLSMLYKYTTIHVAKSSYVRGVGYAQSGGIETFARGAYIISAATETTVSVGTKTDKIPTNQICSWLAIGGLT